MRNLFRLRYYPFISHPVAMSYLRRCMVGGTDEWHEEMIMDILVSKKFVNSQGMVTKDLPLEESQAHALIGQIGLEFEGGGYEGGLIELEEQLDWGDEDRLHASFGKPSHSTSGDARVRQQTTQNKKLHELPLSKRVSMVRRLLEGATGDADESSVIKLLQASRKAGDMVALVDKLGAHAIASDIHGQEWATVKTIFRSSYYARTNEASAFRLLEACIIGTTVEWEQEMIADILCNRADGRRLITRIGGAHEGGGFKDGLNVLEWSLDGGDQTRIENMYGSSGKWW